MESKIAFVGRHPVTPSAAKTLSDYADRLVLLPFEGYNINTGSRPATWASEKQDLIKRCLEDSHGLPGALFFLYLNDALRPYPSECTHPVRRLCVEWAAMAILMHDMKSFYWGKEDSRPAVPQLRLCFDVDPLSSVLALSDILQDFERHAAFFAPNSAADSKVTYRTACKEVEIEYDGRVALAPYRFTENGPEALRLQPYAGRLLQFAGGVTLRPHPEYFARHRAFHGFR